MVYEQYIHQVALFFFTFFTLGSIYSTNASGAEQIPETNKLNQA